MENNNETLQIKVPVGSIVIDATIFIFLMQIYYLLYCAITYCIISIDYNIFYTVINNLAAIPIIGEKIDNILYHKNFQIFWDSFFVLIIPALMLLSFVGYRILAYFKAYYLFSIDKNTFKFEQYFITKEKEIIIEEGLKELELLRIYIDSTKPVCIRRFGLYPNKDGCYFIQDLSKYKRRIILFLK